MAVPLGRVLWVMGGTAVGKKHWILQSGKPYCWMKDGAHSLSALLEELNRVPEVCVRWQWDRERHIWTLADMGVKQAIILLKASPAVQHARALKRERQEVWTAEALASEAEQVEHLARQLAARCKIEMEVQH